MYASLISYTHRLLVGLLLILSCVTADAFKFTPIEAVLSPSGRGTVQSFQLENLGQKPTAVQISVHRRSLDAAGVETLSPADDVLVAYPTQLVLMPGARQSVRLQWRGSATPVREEAFRLVAEQLPLDLDSARADGAALKLLVKYMASVYVRPEGTAAELSAIVEPVGSNKLRLVMRNTGTEHALLKPEWLLLSRDGQAVELDAVQRELLNGKNILAASERHFELPWTGALPELQLRSSQP